MGSTILQCDSIVKNHLCGECLHEECLHGNWNGECHIATCKTV